MRSLLPWLRKPLLHFLCLGGCLFLLQGAWQKYSEVPPVSPSMPDLVISRNQIEQLKRDVFLQTGRKPSVGQIQRLIQGEINDEVLYRKAIDLKLDQNNPSIRRRLIDLAKMAGEESVFFEEALVKKAVDLGLDKNDPVIRRMLITTMQLVAKKVPTRDLPDKVDQKDLEAYYQTHQHSFLKPAQVKFNHIYFSHDKRGDKAKSDAETALMKLADSHPENLSGNGDVFLAGGHFSWITISALDKLFGPAFSRAISGATPKKWSGPAASSYGWHLIFVDELRPAKPVPLSEVVGQIKNIILKQREQQRLSETLEKLRSRYRIIIEEEGAPNA